MKFFLQGIVLIALLFTTSYAGEYEKIKQISLKKDEQKKILVKYENNKILLTFRWTLYVNEVLVMFHSYNGVVGQHTLYLNNQNRSFVVELKTKGANFYNVPSFLLRFKEFDYEQNRAIFELFLSDKRSEIGMELK